MAFSLLKLGQQEDEVAVVNGDGAQTAFDLTPQVSVGTLQRFQCVWREKLQHSWDMCDQALQVHALDPQAWRRNSARKARSAITFAIKSTCRSTMFKAYPLTMKPWPNL